MTESQSKQKIKYAVVKTDYTDRIVHLFPNLTTFSVSEEIESQYSDDKNYIRKLNIKPLLITIGKDSYYVCKDRVEEATSVYSKLKENISYYDGVIVVDLEDSNKLAKKIMSKKTYCECYGMNVNLICDQNFLEFYLDTESG